MAKKKPRKRTQDAGEVLSEEQLAAVAGGVPGGTAAPVLLPELEAEANKKGKASPVLLQACATGEHIKEATITVRK